MLIFYFPLFKCHPNTSGQLHHHPTLREFQPKHPIERKTKLWVQVQERKGKATTSNIFFKWIKVTIIVCWWKRDAITALRTLQGNPLTRRALFEAALSWIIRSRDRSARSRLLRGSQGRKRDKIKIKIRCGVVEAPEEGVGVNSECWKIFWEEEKAPSSLGKQQLEWTTLNYL